MVVLVVLRAERLEQEAIRGEPERRLEVVRDEGHLDIVPPVAFVKTSGVGGACFEDARCGGIICSDVRRLS